MSNIGLFKRRRNVIYTASNRAAAAPIEADSTNVGLHSAAISYQRGSRGNSTVARSADSFEEGPQFGLEWSTTSDFLHANQGYPRYPSSPLPGNSERILSITASVRAVRRQSFPGGERGD
jgi:hypothetical protein